MVNFNADFGSICRRALVNQQIYWRVERDFRDAIAQHRHCCRNCLYFDSNPYLPCAVDPIQAKYLMKIIIAQFLCEKRNKPS